MARRLATNDDIRDLIETRFESLRLEVKGDIKNVADQVTTLDKTVQANALKQTVSSTRLGMLITTITVAGSAITTVIFNKITGRIL
jgi:hypothetical protein